MDKETIQQIAAQVVAQLPLGLLTILNLFIVALVSALTALGVSYFRTGGQNLATKHDFDELQKQLSANTKLVEDIKSDVSQRDWARREWTTLRRVKLEALLEKMHECEEQLDRRRDRAYEGKAPTPERDHVAELRVLAALYFPKLKNEVAMVARICRQERIRIGELVQAVQNAGGDPTALATVSEDFRRNSTGELYAAQDALTSVARSLLERNRNLD
jgi:hypothetical protein